MTIQLTTYVFSRADLAMNTYSSNDRVLKLKQQGYAVKT
jgi:hypothetical protein